VSHTLDFTRHARRRSNGLILLGVWSLLLLIWLQFDASPWIIAVLTLATAPALWGWAKGRRAGLSASDAGLSWYSGPHGASLHWAEVQHLRLDTRLDWSIRATLTLTNGQRLRLPLEAVPDPDALEAVFQARNIAVERHHFSLLG
jgi:hypothetical protein